MKDFQAYTKNRYNMFEVSSLIQKAIRRRDAHMAYFAANELAPKYRKYLWKRILTTSAEDCFDMVTWRIIELYEADCLCKEEDTHNIAIAVSTLLNARKNRDADYFACNLFNSRDNADLSKYCSNPVFDISCSTKNGHCVTDLVQVFNDAIDNLDGEIAGYAANEICVYYRQFCWITILNKARQVGSEAFVREVEALRKADSITDFRSTIFYSKAIVLIMKIIKYGGEEMFNVSLIYNDKIVLDAYDNYRPTMPDYVFDCHTIRGKKLGRNKRTFVVEEQRSLVPLQLGEYDEASWEHFYWLEKNGFWREDYTPHPSKERVKEIESGVFHRSMI